MIKVLKVSKMLKVLKCKEGKHLTHIGAAHLNLHTLQSWNNSTQGELGSMYDRPPLDPPQLR